MLRAALRAIDETDSLRPRVLISLAAAEVQLGHRDAGFALLDQAEALAEPTDVGILLQQRGLLLMLVGHLDEALRCMDAAEPLVEAVGEPFRIARGLLNRAMLHDLAGRIRAALADLDHCERIAEAERLPLLLAKAHLNRGHCETLIGDIPAALRAFDAARPGFAEHAPGLLPVLGVDKARALLAAGLADEAATELDSALALLAKSRTTHERAEAELTRAQTAIAQRRPALARAWAKRAEQRFRRRGNETWAAVAALTVLAADFEAGRRGVADRAAGLAERLAKLGLRTDARLAGLLAARACVAAGRFDDARRHLSMRPISRPSLDIVLSRCLTLAELAAGQNDTGGVFTQARAGLSALHRHRARFGSVDLQTGSAALGEALAGLGLSTAVRSGRPSTTFAWLERSRAQAFRLRPVHPPSDEETLDAVAELRKRASLARTAELAGHPDLATERRCAELERTIRAHGWAADGTGEHDEQPAFREFAEELDAAGSCLVSFLVDREDLVALTIAGGRSGLTRLGSFATVTEAATRLRSDLDTLCGRQLPVRVAEVITASLRYDATTLSDQVVAPLAAVLADRDLVVPTGPLSAVPWGLLPRLRGRPVTVAPSATTWLRGRRRPPRPPSGPLLVAGPNLAHADGEVHAIAGTLPGSTALTGPAASVAATLNALDGAGIAHLAAHGHHEQANMLFSRLDLADGPLMAYDIHQLTTPPEHVVLSACDVGRAIVRAGDEMLGFTAALLYGGTKTVIAGVARVPDDAVVDVMVRYHRIHSRGTPPAKALAEAATGEPFIPLVCFGSG
ncbi:CHAT domain-containing protein [Amycolatopsis balhimycina]|uniref:CHAT domain-containing protein n=1 Tax=Amycolatopsis balhimycina TaxID=208443 RepID=UPI00037FDC75|nr:CHAT domain-containing protein [Amycolatopsis balhimycina]